METESGSKILGYSSELQDSFGNKFENQNKINYPETDEKNSIDRINYIQKPNKWDQILDGVKDFYNNKDLFRGKSGELIDITEKDFNLLSKYEKNTIKMIANIYGIMGSGNQKVDYKTLQEVMNQIGKGRGDIEKDYLIALLFPEKVKNIHTILPFPIPTYTYHQKIQVYVIPNQNGCFLTQIVCPLLLDNAPVQAPGNIYSTGNLGTLTNPAIYNGNILGLQNATPGATTGSVSNMYVNTSPALDGTTLGTPSDFTPIISTQSIPNAFNTYILQCCKVSARYVGRMDVQSGYFGASYHLSAVSNKQPDVNTTQFNYVNESLNAVLSDVSDGINAVYYPPDYSYMNFMQVNRDNVGQNTMSTNLRLNIYGVSMPPPNVSGTSNSAGVVLTFTSVWNVIPTPQYADLLPLDYDLEQQHFNFVETSKFIPKANLASFKNSEVGDIERIMDLPSHVRNNALNDLRTQQFSTGNGKINIVDVLKPLVSGSIPPIIRYDKQMILNRLDEMNSTVSKDRQKTINQLDLMNQAWR